jgi:5-hydroxyisourate hydrolase
MIGMAGISTHVLDTARGVPAAGINVSLHREAVAGVWQQLGAGVTDPDGRVRDLLAGESLDSGTYRLTFVTGEYHRGQGMHTFFPTVNVDFTVDDPDRHFHLPLLLSPYGYSAYRGT